MNQHTPLFASPVLRRLIVAALLLATPAQAEIPEPDHVFYGTATRNGELVLAGEVTVVLDGAPAPAGRYALGSVPAFGDRYVLRLALGFGEPRLPGATRPGDLARFYLDGELAATVDVGGPGEVLRIDLDPFFDDTPELTIGDAAVVEGDAKTVRADFEVRLSRPVTWDVTVGYATADGSATAGSVASGGDYTAAGGTLTLAAGETRGTISVDVHGETVVEPPEDFFVDLVDPVEAAIAAEKGRGRGRINADDTQYVVYVGDAEVLEGDGGDVEAVLAVWVTSEVPSSSLTTSGVTVAYRTADGSATSEEDYHSASGELHVDTGVVCPDREVPCGEIRVAIDPDNRREGPETFTVVLAEADNAVLGDGEGEVTIFDDENFLIFVEAERDGGASLRAASAAVVSPDGRHVYSAARIDDSLSAFERQEATGELTFTAAVTDADPLVDGLGGVEGLAISPDGEHVYAAGFLDDAVAVFSRDASSGALAFVEAQVQGAGGVDGLRGTTAVAVAPDGSHLYAVGHRSAAVVVFSRDASSGALAFASVARDGDGDADGLTGAEAVAVAPDGSHVYVVSSIDSTVVAFERDPGTGQLSFVELEKDGVGGVDGLDGATAVAVAPDGSHVYVAGYLDGAVAVFERDAASGELTFLERKKDGFGGVAGLGGAAAVAVTNDGAFVYAAAEDDSAVAIFRRDPSSGRLVFLEARSDGDLDRRGPDGRLEGLAGATGLALSPDAEGRHVYVVGQADDALAVFFNDTTPPDPPQLASTSHQPGVWSSDPVITVEWSAAGDPRGVGLSGYSFVFDGAPETVPDVELELLHEGDLRSYAAASEPRPDGDSHRFHLRACDHADNCSAAVRVGPFFIDTTPPAPPQDLAGGRNGDVLEMTWTPAVDGGSGVDGYGFAVDASPDAACSHVRELDAAATAATVGPLPGGTWYVHLCAVDRLGHWSSAASAGPYVPAAAPPFVTRVDTVSATAGGLVEGASLRHGITQLLVTFSQAMNDPGGDHAADDVTNPANYRLVSAGADGTGETSGCASSEGDDQLVRVDGVSYLAPASTVALRVNGGVSLPAGRYLLLACSGLTDNSGNLLDGDRDGNGGDPFRRGFEVAIGNRVHNPNFDDGLVSWSPSGNMAAEIVFRDDDADGAWSSGSAFLENLTGPDEVLVLSQCVDLTHASGLYRLAGRVMNTMPPSTRGLSAASVSYWDGAECSGAELGDAMAVAGGSTGGVWQPFETVSPVPAGARSALVTLSVAAGSEPDFGVAAQFDNVVFQPDLSLVFADGFESGDLSLWSSSVP